MPVRPDLPLPDFESPPVTEVALSVQFEPPPGLHAAHFGVVWLRFRDRFPHVQEHPPLERNFELLGEGPQRPPPFRLQVMDRPPVPRCWFINENGTELVQIQKDRFVRNWRKVGTGDEYPRYEPIRDNFIADLKGLEDILLENGLGSLTPNQWEVTYVNHFFAEKEFRSHSSVEDVIRPWTGQFSDDFLQSPEDTEISARFLINDDTDTTRGRLHVNVRPAYRSRGEQPEPILVMTLTARGEPWGDGRDGIRHGLDLGREYVVRGFVSLTTPQAHAIWGRHR